ncbi:unnamed protein product [Brachionus calyciflorus]|uniref:Uncharacterized protein n=1 Tax=Brachionus calyciflorus TaxID=104777 RepID=A0A814I1K6_9BILA|nr:unnamed protein product [Brachionus calyciflorus]
MTSNNNEYNQIDELLQSGQITNAVEFYNYFKNKSNAPSSDFSNLPASSSPIPTSSSSSSISSFSSANKKSSKKCKTTNTLNDYASLLNVPVQNIPKPRFKKTSSTNNLAAYAAPTCHTTPNQNQQYSAYSLNRRSNIFDEYLIGNTDQKPIQNEQLDKVEYTSDSKQTISSIFLKSTNSYYQKYKQHQMTQKPELLVDDKKELEKRKEEAINRIIRNERIKEIRLKMYEYELLKEYQNTDVNVSKSDDYSSSKFSKSVEDFSSLNENLSEELTETSSVDHDYQSRLNSKSKKSINNYFTRTYGATGGNKTIYDEYRSNSNLEDDDEGLFDNDEDYESGIEDDDITINRYQKKQRVKPGYELYQLNSQSGFNFAPNQSKFHLKISIISAEVKNIVNVLKQNKSNNSIEMSSLNRAGVLSRPSAGDSSVQNGVGSTILDTLKKKMSQLKEELEVSRDEYEKTRQILEEEKRRRECVSFESIFYC